MQKQKVFIPVDVNDRSDPIPNKSNVIVLFDNNEVRRMNDSFPFAIATHWLNEQEGYFFTEEEFEEFKKGYTRDTVREIASDFINEFKK